MVIGNGSRGIPCLVVGTADRTRAFWESRLPHVAHSPLWASGQEAFGRPLRSHVRDKDLGACRS